MLALPTLPKISIVVISRDEAEFLPDCLRSITSQKERGVELLAVDLGSRDASREVLLDASQRGVIDRLTVDAAGSPAGALNEAFKHASGDLLGYVCADDILAPGAIRYVRRLFGAYPDVDVLCGAARSIAAGSDGFRGKSVPGLFIAHREAIRQQTTFYRRRAFEAAGGFNPDNQMTWGSELLVDMALAGARVATRSKILGGYRVRDQGLDRDDSRLADPVVESQESLKRKLVEASVTAHCRTRRTLMRFAEKVRMVRHPDHRFAN